MYWRAPRTPRRRLVSPDGWCMIGLMWLAVFLVIAGFKVIDLFGGPPVLKNVYIFQHETGYAP